MRDEAPSVDTSGTSAAARPVRSSGIATRGPWRQPVVWLGVLILLSSLVGCALTIWLATRYPDVPVAERVDAILRMPTHRADAPMAAPTAEPAPPARSVPP